MSQPQNPTKKNIPKDRCENEFFDFWLEMILLIPQAIIFYICLKKWINREYVGDRIYKNL